MTRLDKQRLDRLDLDSALEVVRNQVPGATSLRLQTSDQDLYGFVLEDVTVGEAALSASDPALLSRLRDETGEFLGDLDWDGVVEEDVHGAAVVKL